MGTIPRPLALALEVNFARLLLAGECLLSSFRFPEVQNLLALAPLWHSLSSSRRHSTSIWQVICFAYFLSLLLRSRRMWSLASPSPLLFLECIVFCMDVVVCGVSMRKLFSQIVPTTFSHLTDFVLDLCA
jgi:hypothetical protein